MCSPPLLSLSSIPLITSPPNWVCQSTLCTCCQTCLIRHTSGSIFCLWDELLPTVGQLPLWVATTKLKAQSLTQPEAMNTHFITFDLSTHSAVCLLSSRMQAWSRKGIHISDCPVNWETTSMLVLAWSLHISETCRCILFACPHPIPHSPEHTMSCPPPISQCQCFSYPCFPYASWKLHSHAPLISPCPFFPSSPLPTLTIFPMTACGHRYIYVSVDALSFPIMQLALCALNLICHCSHHFLPTCFFLTLPPVKTSQDSAKASACNNHPRSYVPFSFVITEAQELDFEN